MVVLVGQSDNTTVSLTREGLSATGTISAGLLQATCVTEVIGYDIEFDGTVGTLPLSGELSNRTSEMCIIEKPTVCEQMYFQVCLSSYYYFLH